jgi:tetratricopeptide (TPR) repeat protein
VADLERNISIALRDVSGVMAFQAGTRTTMVTAKHPHFAQRLTKGVICGVVCLASAVALRSETASRPPSEINQAALLYAQGMYGPAERIYRQELAKMEQAVGPNDASLVNVLTQLGTVYTSLGDFRKAEALHRRALAIVEKSPGQAQRQLAIVLSNLAAACYHLGNHAEAESLAQRSLAIQEKVLGAAHTDTVNTVNNLAALYHSQGRLAEAEALYRRCSPSRRRLLARGIPTMQRTCKRTCPCYAS